MVNRVDAIARLKGEPLALHEAVEELKVTVAQLYLYRYGYTVNQVLQLVSTVEDADSLLNSLQLGGVAWS
jgi:hypothetical protein